MSSQYRLLSIVRLACPDDAPKISALYREVYAPPGNGNVEQHYPFPQFLHPEAVAKAIKQGNFRWIVAELDAQIVGTIGAIRNIGTEHDRIAEFFGLVVKPQLHGRGIGYDLLEHLCGQLADEALFMIGETRTADPRGWKLLRRCGFVPLGFEPFAHNMPTGPESMLLSGKVSEQASHQRDLNGKTTAKVEGLAQSVLSSLRLKALPVIYEKKYMAYRVSWKRKNAHKNAQNPVVEPLGLLSEMGEQGITVMHADVMGRQLLTDWSSMNPHASGVVGLRRLEGEDTHGHRYEKQYFVGCIRKSPVACARLVWDRVDRRVRILEMKTNFQGFQGLFLEGLFEQIAKMTDNKPLTVVLDVRADSPELQGTLEKLGCFPSIYYPGLIASASGRIDAVQYTRLYNLDLQESLTHVRHMNWASAREVISQVSSLRQEVLEGQVPAA